MSPRASGAVRRARAVLEREGLLLLHDAELPSVSTLVAGEPVRGSWWGHPAGKAIFHVAEALEAETALVKLVRGKVTFVHRRLWPELAAVGRERAPWQIDGLADDAARVLELVEERAWIGSEEIELAPGRRELAAVVTDLERRLLVFAHQEHAQGSGRHVRVLRSWRRWCRDAGLRARELPGGAAARARLEAPVRAWLAEGARAALPWGRSC